MKFIKIYGLHRCGTNYVEWLIRNNFKDVNVLFDSNVLGWKHGPPVYEVDWTGENWDDPQIPKQDKDKIISKYFDVINPYINELKDAVSKNEVLHVFVFKHPYSWYLSYDRESDKNHVHLPLKEDKIKVWSERNNQFLEFHDKFPEISTIVRYEDFYKNSIGDVLSKIGSKFGVEPNGEWVNQSRTIFPRQDISALSFNMDYYKQEKYLSVIKDNEKDVFRKLVDKDTLDRLNYNL